MHPGTGKNSPALAPLRYTGIGYTEPILQAVQQYVPVPRKNAETAALFQIFELFLGTVHLVVDGAERVFDVVQLCCTRNKHTDRCPPQWRH